MKAQAARAVRAYDTVDWHAAIKDELRDVEDRLLESIGSEVPTVFELSKHLIFAGGKRLRPALVILSALAAQGSPRSSRVTDIAATVELIHMASLVHDDVIDRSDSRRGRITANSFWGNKISVLSGDCMLAKAFSLLARDGDLRVMNILSNVTIRMSESEVLQAVCEHDYDGWRKHYWRIIQGKTAGFLSACCQCGAILGEAPQDTEKALAEYGMNLGMAFQLTDDLLDVVGDPEVIGKPIGSDLRDGKFTLPALLALESMSDVERDKARALLESSELTDDQVNGLCRAICATEAIEMTRDHARSYAERAAAGLDRIPASPVKESMESLASRIIHRIS